LRALRHGFGLFYWSMQVLQQSSLHYLTGPTIGVFGRCSIPSFRFRISD